MNRSLRIFLAGLLLGVLGVVAWLAWQKGAGPPLPDEKKIALERLAESLSGPRYFHATPDAAKPDGQGIVWIEPSAAREQVEGILKERKLDGAVKAKVLKLIEEACEPPPSRVVGNERINLAKLNLALDDLP